MFEIALRWFIRHIHTIALYIVLPAVKNTPQTLFLISSEPEGNPTMVAKLIEDSNAAIRGSKGYQLFSQQLHSNRRAIRLWQLRRQQRRNPVAPHHLTHSCSRPCSGQ